MNEEQCELKADIQEILENMKEWSVDGNLYFEINDEKAKLLYKYICDLQQEIERLNKRIEDLNIINEEHRTLNGMIRKQLQQKENIIKEAREIFKYYGDKEDIVGYTAYYIMGEDLIKVLDILDKENGDGNNKEKPNSGSKN